jgi:outer membrane protein TolC
MKRSSYILIFILIIFPSLVFSQELLTLDDAIRIGLENSFSIKISRNNVEVARNNNTIGNAGYLPIVDLVANQSNSSQNRYQENADETSSNVSGYPTHNLSTGAQLSWTLFDGFSMFIRKEKLGLYQNQSDLFLRMEIENAITDIVFTYYNIVLNLKLYNTYGEQLSLSRQRCMIAREKSRIGVGYELQELQAEVDFRADSAQYIRQGNNVTNLKADLNQLLAREPSVNFDVNLVIPVPKSAITNDIFLKVKEFNPYLLNARLLSQISELEYSEARSSRYPTLNLSGGYNFTNTGTPDGQVQLYRAYGPTIGLGASITLFNGLNASRRIKNAKILSENQQLNQEELLLRLQSTAFKLVNDLNQAIDLVMVEERSVVLAQRNSDAAWERYQLGAISDLELRESQNKLLDAQTRLISAQMNAQLAEIEIRSLTGDMTGFMGQ